MSRIHIERPHSLGLDAARAKAENWPNVWRRSTACSANGRATS